MPPLLVISRVTALEMDIRKNKQENVTDTFYTKVHSFRKFSSCSIQPTLARERHCFTSFKSYVGRELSNVAALEVNMPRSPPST